MPSFVIALVVVFGGLWLIRKMARTPKSSMPAFTQKLAGGALIGISGVLALRGAMTVAVPLFVTGLGLLGKSSAFPNGFPGGFGGFNWGKRSAGQKSRVATSQLAMELDHDSGMMRGEVLAGPCAGRDLASLSVAELQSFRRQCEGAGDQSLPLLDAWLDRAQPEWRQSWGNGGERRSSSSTRQGMTREEALAVLGLKDGATVGDVKAAHKRLMKDFHPDLGGSDYLAAKINQAKDVLLGQ